MRVLLNIVFIFLFGLWSSGQTDTLYFENKAQLAKSFYSDNQQRLNIEKDIIYSVSDSSLYTGYLILANSHLYDKHKWRTSIKHLEFDAGNGELRYFIEYEIDSSVSSTTKRKLYESFKTDSTRTDLSYYPNGMIQKENSQVFGVDTDWIMVTSYFDTTGILTKKINRFQGQRIHGEVSMLLSDSSMLDLHFKHDNLDTVLRNNIHFFSIKDRQISLSEFRKELIYDELNWSLFIHETRDESQMIILYTIDKSCSPIILQEELCLTEKRKKKLIRKLK